MSSLFLVRHGQASFMAANYDQLSPLGVSHGRVLGQHWAALNVHFDRVYIGPRQRHAETMAAVALVYQENALPWPEAELLPQLDEHEGFALLQMLPELARIDPTIQELVSPITDFEELAPHVLLKVLRRAMRLWVRGKIELLGHESWADFRSRTQQGLLKMTGANGNGKTIVAFTSGGPVGVAMGNVLNLADEQTLELAWAVRNGTYSEFLFSDTRISLLTFNSGSHFQKTELITLI